MNRQSFLVRGALVPVLSNLTGCTGSLDAPMPRSTSPSSTFRPGAVRRLQAVTADELDVVLTNLTRSRDEFYYLCYRRRYYGPRL